ncbi:MAG: calcium/sodium antiporter [Patescibacteria group bacterium]|jgi:cation:H+ antiporter
MFSGILFIVGLLLVIKGADFLVNGASSLAKRLKVSELVIGLTIVAFGTSMPELTVNIFASVSGATDIAIGNILGSNIANILLILGISAMIYPLKVTSGTVWKEVPLSFLAAMVIGLMANDVLIDKGIFSGLTRIDGFILMGFFIIFIYYTFGIAKIKTGNETTENFKERGLFKSVGFIFLGLALLILGGKWLVDGATALATLWGISSSLIGLTIVAVGTSFPELATSAVAAYKKNTDIAVGNVVGSNIFNIFWILGISSIIKPLPFKLTSNFDIGATILASLLLFIFMFIGKKHILERWQGLVFILVYILYVSILVMQG